MNKLPIEEITKQIEEYNNKYPVYNTYLNKKNDKEYQLNNYYLDTETQKIYAYYSNDGMWFGRPADMFMEKFINVSKLKSRVDAITVFIHNKFYLKPTRIANCWESTGDLEGKFIYYKNEHKELIIEAFEDEGFALCLSDASLEDNKIVKCIDMDTLDVNKLREMVTLLKE